MHMKESTELGQTALLEKEQAQIREQQLQNENARLKQSVKTIVQEASERTNREVTAVREECNKSVEKMATEIQKIEEVILTVYVLNYMYISGSQSLQCR